LDFPNALKAYLFEELLLFIFEEKHFVYVINAVQRFQRRLFEVNEDELLRIHDDLALSLIELLQYDAIRLKQFLSFIEIGIG